jgi:hypothetical protein
MPYRLFFILLFLPALAHAKDYDGRYMVRGPGVASCGTFAQAMNGTIYQSTDTRFDMMAWAQGYLAHYNRTAENVYDIYGHADAKGIEAWLFSYCAKNPLHTFVDALDALLVQLYPRRIVVAPH